MYNFIMIIMFYMVWILKFSSKAVADTWTNNDQTNKSYYLYDEKPVTWSDAQAVCEARGSRLAVTIAEIDMIFTRNLPNRRTNEQYWIGLIRGSELCGCVGNGQVNCDESVECETCRRSWVWDDGTDMGNYLPWACSRPLGEGRACGVIKKGGTTWDATPCNNERRAVCQYDCLYHGCKRTECNMDANTYSCTCERGYTGQHCDKDIIDCTPESCMNGGTCVDGVNSFSCLCIPGYTGELCETDINECVPDPCINSIECTDAVNNFTCICKRGFAGHTCESEIDECHSEPCMHEGKCINKIGGYECNCTNDYEGANCEIGKGRLAISEEEADDPTIQNAFYAGVALLAVAFIGMIITVVIFIKTKPEASEPVIGSVPERDGIENAGSDDAGASGNSV